MTGRVALGLVFLVAGVAWLLSVTGVVDLSYGVWIGVLLVVIGLAIALVPGRHGVLVLIGVLVAIAGVPALLVEGDIFSGDIGDRTEAPQSAADAEEYRHGIGRLTIDLTSQVLKTEDVAVEASVGIGELLVFVALDADVSVDAHAGIGSLQAFGATEGGFDADLDIELDRSGEGTSAPLVGLDLEVGIGSIRVVRRG